MPLAVAEHEHRVIEAYLWGLLPDEAASVAAEMKREGFAHDVVDRLVRQMAAHALRCKGLAEHAIDEDRLSFGNDTRATPKHPVWQRPP